MNHHQYWNSKELKDRLRSIAANRRKAPAKQIRISADIVDRIDKLFEHRDDKRGWIERVLTDALDHQATSLS